MGVYDPYLTQYYQAMIFYQQQASQLYSQWNKRSGTAPMLNPVDVPKEDESIEREEKGGDSSVQISGQESRVHRICRFFAFGQHCKYGSRCRFEHSWPNQSENTMIHLPPAQTFVNDQLRQSAMTFTPTQEYYGNYLDRSRSYDNQYPQESIEPQDDDAYNNRDPQESVGSADDAFFGSDKQVEMSTTVSTIYQLDRALHILRCQSTHCPQKLSYACVVTSDSVMGKYQQLMDLLGETDSRLWKKAEMVCEKYKNEWTKWHHVVSVGVVVIPVAHVKKYEVAIEIVVKHLKDTSFDQIPKEREGIRILIAHQEQHEHQQMVNKDKKGKKPRTMATALRQRSHNTKLTAMSQTVFVQ